MNTEKHWSVGRLVKVGLSAAVLPTLLVGAVALGTGSSTSDSSELVKHESDLNQDKGQENPVNGGKNKDVDKKEDKKDEDQADKDKDQDDSDKSDDEVAL